ncbi:MAG: NAD(P)-dependent oxidoreductase [Lachnospiraceae bacterium]|nr:NAD(P)-dependent oxidoreductase [Lachnospiraceae bacterium]
MKKRDCPAVQAPDTADSIIRRPLKKAIITGATGMIGAALAELLTSEGVKVTALARPESPKMRNLDKALSTGLVKIVPVSLQALDTFEPETADVWFHFAWDGVGREARDDLPRQMKNVDYLRTAFSKAVQCGVHSFVFAGSQAEYGPVSGVLTEDTPMNPVIAYGKAKFAAETAGNALGGKMGVNFITARILSVFGPYDNDYAMVTGAVRAFLRKERPVFTKGEQIWDYLFSEDAARAMAALSVSGRGGEAYVLGSGDARPLAEYILAIRDAVDPALDLGLGEVPYGPNQVMHLEADISKLVRDTGFKPCTDFRTGIEKTVLYLREKESL